MVYKRKKKKDELDRIKSKAFALPKQPCQENEKPSYRLKENELQTTRLSKGSSVEYIKSLQNSPAKDGKGHFTSEEVQMASDCLQRFSAWPPLPPPGDTQMKTLVTQHHTSATTAPIKYRDSIKCHQGCRRNRVSRGRATLRNSPLVS